MFMNDVNKKEEIRQIAIQDLKGFGIKFRPKKAKTNIQETRTRKVFKVPLHSLPMQIVTLPSGQQLTVPKLIHELCSYILSKVDTEGLFRKGGSKSRQNEIKLSLDAGCYLGEEHHEIDVASVLKTFFRELPEPLFPSQFHEIFLRCMLLVERKLEAVLLCCLLLPCEHLNTLSYFMQFLHQVSEFSSYNKMDASNLAIIIGPTLMPATEEKLAINTVRVNKVCELFKLLIENADKIGLLSNDIIERVAFKASCASINDEEISSMKKKKKRRSGSLTRMLSGLKKIVSSKSEEISTKIVTPDLLMTPAVSKSSKKRKMEHGFSAKKRKEVIEHLPHNAILNTPFTPCKTPISINPNPKKRCTPESCQAVPVSIKKTQSNVEKKPQWYLRTKNKKIDDTLSLGSQTSLAPKSLIERRWSAVSQVASFKRNKKRNSCAPNLENKKVELKQSLENIKSNSAPDINKVDKKLVATEPDYVRISKIEYEDIKNRVSAIERRISIELENIDNQEPQGTVENTIEQVQTAYKKTLEEAGLSPTTDQLVRRFSRELKIRRSSEHKVIRSPSARKIGGMRRRSRELERQNIRLTRHQSWHVPNDLNSKPNVKKGLQEPVLTSYKTPNKSEVFHSIPNNVSDELLSTPTNRRITRSSSIQNSVGTSPLFLSAGSSINGVHQINSSIKTSSSNQSEKWVSAEGFFSNKSKNSSSVLEDCRSSIARLRSQNAGMVMARAKLFDELVDSGSENGQKSNSQVRQRTGNKIGSIRNADKQHNRIRTLKVDESMSYKKTLSPRRRTMKSPTNRSQRLHLAKVIHKENLTPHSNEGNLVRTVYCSKTPPIFQTPKTPMPSIKKPLNVKSPKRLNRTPLKGETRHTPLKAITPRHNRY